jgi:predicted transcriptional regulator
MNQNIYEMTPKEKSVVSEALRQVETGRVVKDSEVQENFKRWLER